MRDLRQNSPFAGALSDEERLAVIRRVRLPLSMRREDLEHIIRACAEVTGDTDIVVVGSQAILGSFPTAPAPMLILRRG